MKIGRFLGVNRALMGGESESRRFHLPGLESRWLPGFLHRWRISEEYLSDVKSSDRGGQTLIRRAGGRLLM